MCVYPHACIVIFYGMVTFNKFSKYLSEETSKHVKEEYQIL